MKDLKRILRSTLIYLFGNVSTKLVSFLLIPIYTSYISPADFGKYDVDANYATLISSVLFLDIWSGIMRFIYDQNSEKDKYKVIYSGLVVFFCSFVLYIAAFLLLKDFLDIRYQFWVFLYGFMICLQNLYGYLSRSLGFNVLYAFSGFLSTLINALLNIVGIVYLKAGYEVLFISFSLGILIQCLLLEAKVKLIVNFRPSLIDRKIIKEIFIFSFPLCINSVCYWLLTSYNKVVVYEQLSAAENGYYAIAMKFSLALNLVASCFSLAWQELAYSKSENDKETYKFYSNATNLYFKLLFFGAVGLISVVAIIFPFFIDASYANAKAIIPIYILATVFSIFSTFLGNILGAYKRNNVIFTSTLCACIVNVVVVHLLIHKLGLQAATIAMLLGYVVNCYIRGILLYKTCELHFDFKVLLYMIPIFACVLFVYNTFGLGLNLIMIIFICCIALFIFRNEVRMIMKTVANLRKQA